LTFPITGTIASTKEVVPMHTLLWILALLIGIWGVVTLIRGQVILGIVLIVVALLVGPGGVSIFS
jgi:hypothetical protein